MLRTLRAFAWMRWRVLLNSLERTGARDTLERLSLAVEQIGPIIALVLLVPSAVGLAGLGGYAGYWLTAGQLVVTFEVLRILLLAACGFAVVGPMLMPSMEPTAVVRLLLLPIPRGTLYAAQAAGALSEPWVLISLPVALSVPIGLALGGAWLAAALSLAAGLLLILCLIGLSTLSTLLLHLVVRDRRRGELLALLFIVLVPAAAMLPGLLASSSDGRDRAGHPRRGDTPMPAWVARGAEVAYAVVPSELFVRATRSPARHEPGAAIVPLLVLLSSGLLLHGVGILTFGRLLDSPSAGIRRRSASTAEPVRLQLPFLSRGSAAVAHAQVRLAMRTPRGRSILLGPFVVFLMLVIAVYRQGRLEIGFINLTDGLSLATFGGAVCLLSILPFAMNQFAIDRSGLTMALLSPLDTRELLAGKAVGNGLIAAGPAVLAAVVSFVLFPGGSPALWLSLPLALAATYALAAPGAAALSALFPRTVDLNSIGRGSNAHGFANLLGLLMFVAAGVPSTLIVLLTGLAHIPALTPIALLLWCGIALVTSRALFSGVAVLFDKRRENLGIVAS